MEEAKIKIETMDGTKINEASERISGVVHTTPLQLNTGLSEKYNCNIFLKREDLQIVRSFKIRGAYNKMATLSLAQLKNGVVCASAGNHAQGVAFACNKLKVKGKIFMPNPTPNQKIKKVKQFGGSWVEIILTGDSFDDAQVEAKVLAANKNITFIHPFNDIDVIAGQGTIAKEMLENLDHPLDILMVAIGGGGLMAGVSTYFKTLSPATKIIGIEASGAAAMHTSIQQNKLVKLTEINTFADGIAVKEVGSLTFEICKQHVDQFIQVPEGKISSTILELYNEEAIVAEPAGAVSIAALDLIKDELKGKNIGIILCGGNNDIDRTQEIQERALLYEGIKHYFIIKFPQRAGALRDFLNVLGPDDDITHFQYTKKNNRESGPALVGIELGSAADFPKLLEKLKARKINFRHLNDDPTLFETLV